MAGAKRRAGCVVLMAGAGPATCARAVRFHAAAVKATHKASPTIAYVGAASNDSLVFEKLVSRLVFGSGASVVPVRLKKKALTTGSARGLLADADLVFFTGGDVERGMQLIEGRDLGGYLRALHAQGKVMEGISAGAIMLGRHWVRFRGDDQEKAEAFECLGIVPRSFDTHGEADEWGELRALARVLPAVDPGERVVFGIPSGGCALWDEGQFTAVGAPLVRVGCGPAPRFLAELAPGT